jgi:hypothetical protein
VQGSGEHALSPDLDNHPSPLQEQAMPDSTAHPNEPQPQRKYKEYEDPHYHDDDVEIVPADDVDQPNTRTPPRRKPNRRPPPRRHYDEE